MPLTAAAQVARTSGSSAAGDATAAPAAKSPALVAKPVDKAGQAGRVERVVQDEKIQLRVLLAEDQMINAQITGFMLEQMDATYVHALDGEAAVRLYQTAELPFDLVLMDYQMPHMDGPTATQAIRRWEVDTLHRATPIIALTANASEESRQICLRAGMNGFLSKPVEFAVLQQVIYTHVTRARLEGLPGGRK